jgi:uncharacterized cupredoxin-like copper-binding protein
VVGIAFADKEMPTMRLFALTLVAALALSACTAPAAPAKPAASGAPAKPAAPQKPPGPYTPNGEVDASSGKIALQHLDTMRFQPNTVGKAKAGSTITVEMKNAGSTIHSIISPALGVPNKVALGAGQSGNVTFTLPAQPGTYFFWCPEPGHGEAGMSGQVVVE